MLQHNVTSPGRMQWATGYFSVGGSYTTNAFGQSSATPAAAAFEPVFARLVLDDANRKNNIATPTGQTSSPDRAQRCEAWPSSTGPTEDSAIIFGGECDDASGAVSRLGLWAWSTGSVAVLDVRQFHVFELA
jgi:hypothetical protein